MHLTAFSTREMFQPKYYWVEIKYLGAIQNRRRQLFAEVIMLFLNISRQMPRQLPRADVN